MVIEGEMMGKVRLEKRHTRKIMVLDFLYVSLSAVNVLETLN